MAEVNVTITVKQDRQKRFQVGNFKDSIGNTVAVDGGVQGITVESGAAEQVVDALADPTGLQVVYKSDLSATTFPSTSVIRSFVDTKLGDEVGKLEIVATVITLASEAVTMELNEIGDEARQA